MKDSEGKRIINSCQTCRTPIYEGEPIYTSSKGQNSGYSGGVFSGKHFKPHGYGVGTYGGYHKDEYASESWVQCAWCYDQWQSEVAANKSFWWKWWLGGILLVLISTIISIFMFPGLERVEMNNLKNNAQNPTNLWRMSIFWKVSLIHLTIFVVGIFLLGILGYFLQPKVDRYKLRNHPNYKNE